MGNKLPILIWNDFCQTVLSVFFGLGLHGFISDVREQAASTMHQSDMRGLAAAGRPGPTVRSFVESAAFYEREYSVEALLT